MIKQFYFKQFSLTSTTTPAQSGPGTNGNQGVLDIAQSSNITGASPSNYLVSYLGQSLGVAYSSAEMQSLNYAASADWVNEDTRKKSVCGSSNISWFGN